MDQLNLDFSLPGMPGGPTAGSSAKKARPRKRPCSPRAHPVLPLESAPPPNTFAAVVEALKRHRGISDRLRRDLISGITSLARFLRLPPAQIRTDIPALREALQEINGATVGRTSKRFANVRSDAVRALKLVGVDGIGAQLRNPYTAEWHALRGMLPTVHFGIALARFMRWASDQGIEPAEVDTAVLDRFVAAMGASSLKFKQGSASPHHRFDME